MKQFFRFRLFAFIATRLYRLQFPAFCVTTLVICFATQIAGAQSTDSTPSPFILYWGGLEARLNYEKTPDAYTSEVRMSPEALLEAIKREPRLWDGKTLLETLAIEVNGLPVSSDYNRPEIYQTSESPLRELLKGLKEQDRVTIGKFVLPDGKNGSVVLLIGKSEFEETQKFMEKARITDIIWGKQQIYWLEKRYLSTAEFWDLLLSEPAIKYTDETLYKPQRWHLSIHDEADGSLLFSFGDANMLVDLNKIREQLDQEHALIRPGARVSFNIWDPVQENTKLQLDTIVTFDPVTYQETVTILRKSEVPSTMRFPMYTELFSCILIGDTDPRRFLRLEPPHDYVLKWGSFSLDFPTRAFGQSYYTAGQPQVLYSDNKKKMWNNRLNAKEAAALVTETPQLMRNREAVKDFSFTISCAGRDYRIEKGIIPAELSKTLTRLQPGEIFSIKNIEAHGTPVRYLTGPEEVLKQEPELESQIRTMHADTLKIYTAENQQLLRLALPVKKFEALRPKLEKIPGIWLQQGDVDLTPFVFDLEIRDADPKPVLPGKD